jgi:hypothetical protein
LLSQAAGDPGMRRDDNQRKSPPEMAGFFVCEQFIAIKLMRRFF